MENLITTGFTDYLLVSTNEEYLHVQSVLDNMDFLRSSSCDYILNIFILGLNLGFYQYMYRGYHQKKYLVSLVVTSDSNGQILETDNFSYPGDISLTTLERFWTIVGTVLPWFIFPCPWDSGLFSLCPCILCKYPNGPNVVAENSYTITSQPSN